MKCEKVRRRIADYVDGVLRSGPAEAVREHLASCAACREEEASARAVVEALASLPELAAPEDGLARLEARLAFLPPRMERERPGLLRTFILPYMAGLASAAVLLLVVLPLVSGTGPAPAAPGGVAAGGVPAAPAALRPGEEPLHYVMDDENILREFPPELLRMLRERRLLRPAEAPDRSARPVGYEGY